MNNSEQFNLTNFNVNFHVAPNGVFYKTNESGASLYYSSKTEITNCFNTMDISMDDYDEPTEDEMIEYLENLE